MKELPSEVYDRQIKERVVYDYLPKTSYDSIEEMIHAIEVIHQNNYTTAKESWIDFTGFDNKVSINAVLHYEDCEGIIIKNYCTTLETDEELTQRLNREFESLNRDEIQKARDERWEKYKIELSKRKQQKRDERAKHTRDSQDPVLIEQKRLARRNKKLGIINKEII